MNQLHNLNTVDVKVSTNTQNMRFGLYGYTDSCYGEL